MKDIPMKDIKNSDQPSRMSADSQDRLLAYSTAASLGAFFAGQNAEAAVVQAPGLAPYPHVILPQPAGSTNGTYLNLSIEGGSITNFLLNIAPDLLSHPTNKFGSQLVDMIGFVPDTNNPAIRNGQALTPLRGAPAGDHGWTNAYCVAFYGGAIIGNNTNTTAPWYQPRLALSYNYGGYPWVNYAWNAVPGFPSEIAGFEFTSSVDGQNHFGYMDFQISFVTASIDYITPSGTTNTATKKIVKSLVINDCRYETTPDADIIIPKLIKITSVTTEGGLVTINFGPNSTENDDPSVFALETSPTLGPSASWTTDAQASIYQLTQATPTRPATYQAQTVPTPGAISQYYRIKKL
jgi:hypothetical protein